MGYYQLWVMGTPYIPYMACWESEVHTVYGMLGKCGTYRIWHAGKERETRTNIWTIKGSISVHSSWIRALSVVRDSWGYTGVFVGNFTFFLFSYSGNILLGTTNGLQEGKQHIF